MYSENENKNRAVLQDVIFRACLFHGNHVGVCTTMYSTQWVKITFIVAMEKCRQLAIYHLRIIIQITACPTYAHNNRQIATCIAP